MQNQKQANYYTMLDIKENASQEEIKRAYYRMVRKFPPEKEPEKFKMIRMAYETLSDPKARSAYDSMEKYGEEISQLFDEASTLMNLEEWEMAIPKLKRVLVLAPEANAARNMMGLCYLYLKKFQDAQKTFEGLVLKASDVPAYWENLGVSYMAEANNTEGNGTGFEQKRHQLYEKARQSFSLEMNLESFNPDPYISIAISFRNEKNYQEAAQWIEKAAALDNLSDMGKFEALIELSLIYLYSQEFMKIEQLATRLKPLVPVDTDARKYAAWRFAEIGLDLYKFCAYSAALSFFNAARQFDPDSQALKDILEGCQIGSDLLEKFDDFMKDERIIPPLRGFGHILACDFLEKPVVDKENYINQMSQALVTWTPVQIKDSINRIKIAYPFIYKLNTDFFDKVMADLREKGIENSHSPYNQQSDNQGSPGCMITAGIIMLFIPPLTLFGIGLIIFGVLGAFANDKR